VEPLPAGFPCQCVAEEAKPAVQQAGERSGDVHPPAPTDAAANPTSPMTGAERSFLSRVRRSMAESAESQPAKDCKPCQPAAPSKTTPEQADSSNRKSVNCSEEKLPPTDVVSKWGQTATATPNSAPADATTAKAEQPAAVSPAPLRIPEVLPSLSKVAAVE